jgi:TRAP-type mannitol/chloroaromatic compound transport system permease small subunit
VTPAEKFAGGIDRFVDAVGRITAWSSFALALVMGGNVLLRYGFNTGSVWSQELEWHLMSPICLFGMSYALRHGEHVRVDVVFATYSQRNKYLVEFISALLAMTISLIIIKLSWAYVMQSWNIGEGTANPGGISGRYILKGLIPVGFALLFLQSLAQAIQYFLAWRGRTNAV